MERQMQECPVCGEECNEFFVSDYGNEIVGCKHCIHTEDAYERAEADRYDAKIDYEYERRG